MGTLPINSVKQDSFQIKCIVFDFDGVLLDTPIVKRNAYYDIFAALGHTKPVVDEVLSNNKKGDRFQVIGRIISMLIKDGVLKPETQTGKLVQRYANEYNEICEEYAKSCHEIPGVSEILPLLYERFSLYINSATPEEPLQRIVKSRGWNVFFRGILGSPRSKVENLRLTFLLENLAGNNILFVGDEQGDMDAAVECKCFFASMINDTSQFETKPLYTLSDLSEIPALIIRLESGIKKGVL